MAIKDNMMQDLIYGDMLTTPGYDVEFAMGTTYSLDMKALLIVPYSLGMFGDLSDNVKASPLFLLESIRRSSDKFVLFCHRGGIHMPKETASYSPLLENSIFEVKTEPTANFHPKMWLIREHLREDKEQKQLKLMVMSKNITFDNNLDVVISLTGAIDTKKSNNAKRHQPLKEMVERLADYAKGKTRRRVLELADDLMHVTRFEVDESRFERDEYEFVPFMFGENLNAERVSYPEAFQGEAVMAISPFIDESTIKDLTAVQRRNGQMVLVTRVGYVDEKIFQYYHRENAAIYVMNDQMVNNDRVSIDLHAKAYFVSWPKSDAGHFLYLGSANATSPAFHKNCEMLVRLKLKNGHYLFERFKNEFLQMNEKGESDVFEQVNEPMAEPEGHAQSVLESFVRKLVNAPFRAKVSGQKGNGLYDIALKTKADGSKYHVTIAPLQAPSLAKPLCGDVTFEDLPLSKLSAFYLIHSINGEEHLDEVIKITTDGIPEERDDEIFRSIVDTKDKFYNYLSFMLCDDPEEFVFELEQAEKALKASEAPAGQVHLPRRIYEQMLKIASHDPEQLLHLDDVTRIVKNEAFSKEFRQLFETFRPIIPKLKKLL